MSAPSIVLMAGRHLDPAEGVMRVGYVVTKSDLSALRIVLHAAAKWANGTDVAAAEARGRKQAAHDIADSLEASGAAGWRSAAFREAANIARAYAAEQDTGGGN